MSDRLRKWVKRELKLRGMSQRELARRSGVSHTLVSDALRGDRPITFDFCLAISKGLKVPMWYVLDMADFTSGVPQDLQQSEELKVLIEKFNSLSSSGKEDLLKYLDWLLLREE